MVTHPSHLLHYRRIPRCPSLPLRRRPLAPCLRHNASRRTRPHPLCIIRGFVIQTANVAPQKRSYQKKESRQPCYPPHRTCEGLSKWTLLHPSVIHFIHMIYFFGIFHLYFTRFYYFELSALIIHSSYATQLSSRHYSTLSTTSIFFSKICEMARTFFGYNGKIQWVP